MLKNKLSHIFPHSEKSEPNGCLHHDFRIHHPNHGWFRPNFGPSCFGLKRILNIINIPILLIKMNWITVTPMSSTVSHYKGWYQTLKNKYIASWWPLSLINVLQELRFKKTPLIKLGGSVNTSFNCLEKESPQYLSIWVGKRSKHRQKDTLLEFGEHICHLLFKTLCGHLQIEKQLKCTRHLKKTFL